MLKVFSRIYGLFIPLSFLVSVIAVCMLLSTFKERFQVAEGISMLDNYKERMLMYYADTGSWPQTLAEVTGQSEFDSNGFTILARDGTLEVEYGDKALAPLRGKLIDIVPYLQDDGSVVWQCGTAAVPASGTPDGVNRTNVPSQYLPGSCRA